MTGLAAAAKKNLPQENTVLTQNREMLLSAIEDDKSYLANVIKDVTPDEFKSSVEELAGNTYLMEKIPVARVVRVAAQAAAMGLSVSPIHKECYILPFNVKGQGMVASIVVSKKGLQEMAFRSGFFLNIDPVWKIDSQPKKESEMNLIERAELDDSDPKFFNEFMLGWFFTLKDISTDDVKLDDQEAFVSLKKAKAVTQAMQAPDHSLMQAYVHKAARQAVGQFYTPRKRGERFAQMVKIDDEQAISVEVINKPVSMISNSVSPDRINELLGEIKSASTPDEMRAVNASIAGLPRCDGKAALIEAYKDQVSKLKAEESKKAPTYAEIEDKINKAKTKVDIKNLAGDIDLIADQAQGDELRIMAVNKSSELVA